MNTTFRVIVFGAVGGHGGRFSQYERRFQSIEQVNEMALPEARNNPRWEIRVFHETHDESGKLVSGIHRGFVRADKSGIARWFHE